jgi:hemin uptake protein HemP
MTSGNDQRPANLPAAAGGAQPSRKREITSAELLGGAREIRIHHANEIYTLRRTSKGKLILTK